MAADRIQERTISHTGSELGEDSVLLKVNQTYPQRKSTIVSFECPRKYESLVFNGARHWTKLMLRTLEEFEGGDAVDGDTISLETRLTPIAGEEDLDDQPFPAVVAYNVTADEEAEIVDVNYAQNQITLADAPDSDEIKVYPMISQGAIQYQGVNQFGQVEGSVDKWATPIYRWLDFDQDKRGTEINLQGQARWTRNERLEMVLDSPQEVVWEDEHYPLGSYVSHIEQRVDIEL